MSFASNLLKASALGALGCAADVPYANAEQALHGGGEAEIDERAMSTVSNASVVSDPAQPAQAGGASSR